METKFVKIDGIDSENAAIAEASEIIRRGGIVAIPTETVYGLAGSALIPESAEKIYAAKGRPSDNPLIVHIACSKDAEKIAHTCEAYYRLAEKFMPGPLTIILKKKLIIPDTVTGGLDTVAIRCPSNRIAHRLIEESAHPIAAPSANRSGIPSPTNARHVYEDMNGRIDMIIDGGECEFGLESTVVKLEDDGCTILRPGAVTAEMLSEVCRRVTISPAVIEPALVANMKVESPGMKYKHYSPKAEVKLIDGSYEEIIKFAYETARGKWGILLPDKYTDADINGGNSGNSGVVFHTGKAGNAHEEGHRLFALLREADEAGLDELYVKLPPKDGEYLAIYNRIIRAAGCRIIKLNDNK